MVDYIKYVKEALPYIRGVVRAFFATLSQMGGFFSVGNVYWSGGASLLEVQEGVYILPRADRFGKQLKVTTIFKVPLLGKEEKGYKGRVDAYVEVFAGITVADDEDEVTEVWPLQIRRLALVKEGDLAKAVRVDVAESADISPLPLSLTPPQLLPEERVNSVFGANASGFLILLGYCFQEEVEDLLLWFHEFAKEVKSLLEKQVVELEHLGLTFAIEVEKILPPVFVVRWISPQELVVRVTLKGRLVPPWGRLGDTTIREMETDFTLKYDLFFSLAEGKIRTAPTLELFNKRVVYHAGGQSAQLPLTHLDEKFLELRSIVREMENALGSYFIGEDSVVKPILPPTEVSRKVEELGFPFTYTLLTALSEYLYRTPILPRFPLQPSLSVGKINVTGDDRRLWWDWTPVYIEGEVNLSFSPYPTLSPPQDISITLNVKGACVLRPLEKTPPPPKNSPPEEVQVTAIARYTVRWKIGDKEGSFTLPYKVEKVFAVGGWPKPVVDWVRQVAALLVTQDILLEIRSRLQKELGAYLSASEPTGGEPPRRK